MLELPWSRRRRARGAPAVLLRAGILDGRRKPGRRSARPVVATYYPCKVIGLTKSSQRYTRNRGPTTMARLPTPEYPEPRLRIRAEHVTVVDDEIKRLVDDMFETMYAAPGIGLAAPQVDVHRRVIVIAVSETRDEPYCLINPEIVWAEGRDRYEEEIGR